MWITLTGDVIELIGYCFDLTNKMLWIVMYDKFDKFVNDVMFFVYAGWFNRLDRFFK